MITKKELHWSPWVDPVFQDTGTFTPRNGEGGENQLTSHVLLDVGYLQICWAAGALLLPTCWVNFSTLPVSSAGVRAATAHLLHHHQTQQKSCHCSEEPAQCLNTAGELTSCFFVGLTSVPSPKSSESRRFF